MLSHLKMRKYLPLPSVGKTHGVACPADFFLTGVFQIIPKQFCKQNWTLLRMWISFTGLIVRFQIEMYLYIGDIYWIKSTLIYINLLDFDLLRLVQIIWKFDDEIIVKKIQKACFAYIYWVSPSCHTKCTLYTIQPTPPFHTHHEWVPPT